MSIVAPSAASEADQRLSAVVVRRREAFAFAGVVLSAAVLRLWRLDQNGLGNTYYAAAVRSMLMSWTNFLFAAFDPAGYVSVDKPPIAIWVQTAFAYFLGYRGVSLLLPQAIAGVATVAILTRMVWKYSGAPAGLIAGVVLAISPISVAVDRSNLPDSQLVLALVLGAWALLRASNGGGIRWLLLSAVFVGIGFNIKMLAAFVVLPTFYLVYLFGASGTLAARLSHLTAATIVLATVSLSWAALVDLTPPENRPYIGGSTNNSALNLALGYNGLGRVFGGSGNPGSPVMGPGGPEMGFPGGGPPMMGGGPPMMGGGPPMMGGGPPMMGGGPPIMGGGPGGMPGLSMGLTPFGGPAGLLRFFYPGMAGQITWLFPLAFVGAVATAMRSRLWRPLKEDAQALLLWSGWFTTHFVVFSFSRGIMHPYYVTVMAPAVAALVGPGIIAMLADFRSGGRGSSSLLIGLLLTAVWQVVIVAVLGATWRAWLIPLMVVGAGSTALSLHKLRHRDIVDESKTDPSSRSRMVSVALIGGIAALAVAPLAWALTCVIAKGSGFMPAADPALLSGMGLGALPGMTEGEDHSKLLAFLRANHRGERFLLATPNAPSAASLIAEAGEPVMAIGGFIGSDPILTAETFAKKVNSQEVRFVMVHSFNGPPGMNGPFPPGMNGPSGVPPGGFGGDPFGGSVGGMPGLRSEIVQWVKENGKLVEPALWKSESPVTDAPPSFATGGLFGVGGMTLYDCLPAFESKAPERSKP